MCVLNAHVNCSGSFAVMVSQFLLLKEQYDSNKHINGFSYSIFLAYFGRLLTGKKVIPIGESNIGF